MRCNFQNRGIKYNSTVIAATFDDVLTFENDKAIKYEATKTECSAKIEGNKLIT